MIINKVDKKKKKEHEEKEKKTYVQLVGLLCDTTLIWEKKNYPILRLRVSGVSKNSY